MSSNPPLSKKEELLLWDMIVVSGGTFEFDRTIVNHKTIKFQMQIHKATQNSPFSPAAAILYENTSLVYIS